MNDFRKGITDRLKTFYFLILSALFLSGCKTTSKTVTTVTVNCADPKPAFTADIKPILDAGCAAKCHSKSNKAGGIDLSGFSTVKDVAMKKKFLGAIKHEKGFHAMPKKGPKLSAGDINKIECWIQGGMVQ